MQSDADRIRPTAEDEGGAAVREWIGMGNGWKLFPGAAAEGELELIGQLIGERIRCGT